MKVRKRIFLVILVSLFVFASAGYSLLLLSRSRSFQIFGRLVDRVETDEKVVALTFDDAPGKGVDEVLGILADKDVKATFYAIGRSMELSPGETEEMVRQGHELGNHSYSHKRLVFKSQSFIQGEIERTDRLIRDAGHQGEITFRPPNGKKLFGLPWFLSRRGTRTVMWDVEPDTFHHGDADMIAKYALDEVKTGSILLMHPFCGDACSADKEALPAIIDGLTAKGYRFLTIGQMLELEGKGR